jgi:hypothetical protein
MIIQNQYTHQLGLHKHVPACSEIGARISMGLVCGMGNRVASNAYAKHVNPWFTYRLVIFQNKLLQGIDDSVCQVLREVEYRI